MAKKSPKPEELEEKAQQLAAPSDMKDDDIEEEEQDLDLENRKKDYSGLVKVREQMSEIYQAVVRGFEDKQDQNSTIDANWDMYNCVLNENQAYSGYSNIYIPLVRDAIEARVTRFSNQLFPQSGQYSQVVGTGDPAWDLMAILNYYVTQSKLKSIVVPSLMREGDCSGQYSLHIDWTETTRHTVKKVKKPVTVSPELGVAADSEETYEDREYEEIVEGKPDVMVIDARNLVFLPASVDDAEDGRCRSTR